MEPVLSEGWVNAEVVVKELLFCMLWLVKLRIACFEIEQQVEI